jgi:penicillin amidase
MKTTLKVIATLLLIFLLAGIVLYGYLLTLKPQMGGKIELKNLQDSVNVYFDKYGIPHIYAQNEPDAYRALGYLHAQERLFQMEMILRVASGRLSEILGRDFIQTDKFFRTLGINQFAEKTAATYLATDALPYQKAALAYLDGINQFIENGKTPIEFTLLNIPKEKFTPQDCYLVTAYMAFGFAQAFMTDPLLTKIYEKLGKDYYDDLLVHSDSTVLKIPVMQSKGVKLDYHSASLKKPLKDASELGELASLAAQITDLLPVPLLHGSNSWIISGAKSKSGKPLLSNDAHIGYAQPAVWFEAHLEYPNMSFYGNFLAGFPFGIIGHNRTAGWGLTMFENDDIDFYREKINPEQSNQVWYKGSWVDLEIRNEVVKVKNEADVKFQVRSSKHGAIINDVIKEVGELNSAPVAVWWTMLQNPTNALQAIYKLMHAQSLNEAQKAVSLIDAPGLNVMYANQNGDIAWWAAAKLPKRPTHVNSMLILDGASGKDEAEGYHYFVENPQNINPNQGYLYSANNQPEMVNDVLYSGYYLTDDRARRIVQLLESRREKWDMKALEETINDVTSASAAEQIKLFFNIIESDEPAQTQLFQHPSIDILKKWKGNYNKEEIAPTIYTKWLYFITEGIFLDELGERDFNTLQKTHLLLFTLPKIFNNPHAVWWDNIASKEIKESRKEILIQSFNNAIKTLESQLDTDVSNWQWGRVHLLEHIHPLGRQKPLNYLFNVGTFSMNGGAEVINNIKSLLSKEKIQKVTAGPSKRILIDLADIENAQSVLPTGQSGYFLSKHYDDQTSLYNEGKFRKMLMNEKEILANKKSTLIFQKVKEK